VITESRLGGLVALLVLFLAPASPVVYGLQTTPPLQLPSCGTPPPEATAVTNALIGIFAAIQIVVLAVIGLAWITGNLMWASPTRSMIIKKGGQQQMEIAGISLFLTLMGPGIFAFIIFLAKQFGTFTWAFCPS